MTENSDGQISLSYQGGVAASPVRDVGFIDSRAPDIQDLIAGAKLGAALAPSGDLAP